VGIYCNYENGEDGEENEEKDETRLSYIYINKSIFTAAIYLPLI
jgi:hypothetical protein